MENLHVFNHHHKVPQSTEIVNERLFATRTHTHIKGMWFTFLWGPLGDQTLLSYVVFHLFSNLWIFFMGTIVVASLNFEKNKLTPKGGKVLVSKHKQA